MTKTQINKVAVSFSILAFAILVFGSVFTGSRFSTALIRGVEAALVFGVFAWAISSLLFSEKEQSADEPPIEEDKGAQLDETV